MKTYQSPAIQVQAMTVYQVMAVSNTIPLGPGVGGNPTTPIMA